MTNRTANKNKHVTEGLAEPEIRRETEYWVTMTDKFMSGWGMALHKTNKLIIECETLEQAETIARNAEKRPEMKRINICSNKPYYGRGGTYESWKYYRDLGECWTK